MLNITISANKDRYIGHINDNIRLFLSDSDAVSKFKDINIIKKIPDLYNI